MELQQDIVILGGGIAGLWLLHRLRKQGFAAVLLEKNHLGKGQTIASQGMIHGGLKYALSGTLTGASEAIADMPAHWRRCLEGEGDVDLRGVELLSDAYYLWPRNTLGSRLTAYLGSKLVSSKAQAVSAEDVPLFFKGNLQGPLYRLHDLVLNVPSLLQTLSDGARDWIYQTDSVCETDANGKILALRLPDGRRLNAQYFVCTSGNGNAEWLSTLRPAAIAMQQRPLQMVVVKHKISSPLFVHCVADFAATPELTITTHACRDGSIAWYLGGELAEQGAQLDSTTLVQRARQKLGEFFPWCDLSQASFACLAINRAEALQPGNKRPDQESVLQQGNVLYCWPTKLTLAPALAESVVQLLHQQDIRPSPRNHGATISGLPHPAVAQPPWETA
jgi:glycine/D-amino acid oxidase-like deaminating enzyme